MMGIMIFIAFGVLPEIKKRREHQERRHTKLAGKPKLTIFGIPIIRRKS
jgi:hypothetical protein